MVLFTHMQLKPLYRTQYSRKSTRLSTFFRGEPGNEVNTIVREQVQGLYTILNAESQGAVASEHSEDATEGLEAF